MPDYMALLSGGLGQRATLLATLANAGIDVDQDHSTRGLDASDPTVGWIACRHADVDELAARAGEAGWALRAHWNTPECAACDGTSPATGVPCGNCASTGRTEKRPPTPEQQLAATIAELNARIAALETKGA